MSCTREDRHTEVAVRSRFEVLGLLEVKCADLDHGEMTMYAQRDRDFYQ